MKERMLICEWPLLTGFNQRRGIVGQITQNTETDSGSENSVRVFGLCCCDKDDAFSSPRSLTYEFYRVSITDYLCMFV